MPSFPPRSAVQAAQRRFDQAREAMHGGIVMIEGRSYEGSAIKGAFGPMVSADGGSIEGQPLYVTISKSLVKSPHAAGVTVIHDRKGWKIETISGNSEIETSWRYVCIRQPGADL